ncbi:MAG TPA: hypothetical protein DCR35_11680 [Runella sp.]|nr:hypothetical protein [Runella sp.]HAO49898.1 hypothetical protein [Runella sp.]
MFSKKLPVCSLRTTEVIEVKSADKAVFNRTSHTFELGDGHTSFELHDTWIRGQRDAMSNSSIPGVPNSAGILTYGIDNGIIKKFLAGVDHSGTGYVLRVE